MAGYWPSSFFACLWTETESSSINWQKTAGLLRRSRVTGHKSQVTGHGAQVTGHRSRVAGARSQVADYRLRI